MFLHNIRRFKDSIISKKAKQLSVKNFGENPQQGQKKGRPAGAASLLFGSITASYRHNHVQAAAC